MADAEIHKLLEPFETHVSDHKFWNHTSEDLCILCSTGLFEGNQHSLVEIELPDDFPKTISKALGEEITDKHTTVAS